VCAVDIAAQGLLCANNASISKPQASPPHQNLSDYVVQHMNNQRMIPAGPSSQQQQHLDTGHSTCTGQLKLDHATACLAVHIPMVWKQQTAARGVVGPHKQSDWQEWLTQGPERQKSASHRPTCTATIEAHRADESGWTPTCENIERAQHSGLATKIQDHKPHMQLRSQQIDSCRPENNNGDLRARYLQLLG
jgi:hypothetical protein